MPREYHCVVGQCEDALLYGVYQLPIVAARQIGASY